VVKVEEFEEIDWSPKPVLEPGMDIHKGTVYYTIPLLRSYMKPGKGKGGPTKVTELQTYVVTSDHEGFFYDTESLAPEGYVPNEQVYQEQQPRWSLASARGYLDGTTPTVSTQSIYATLRDAYTAYVEFADELSYDLMALFNLYTYVFRLFQSTGYIHFHGTAASGKSRNLGLLNALAFNAVWASSMSAPSLYRKLAGSPGTTCIDESEGFDGERGEELRRILNAGYKDGAKVIRTEKGANDRFTPVEYNVFGPKALASINPLEPVIASRCIVVNMRPAIRQLADFNSHDARWQDARDMLYLWAIDNATTIAMLVAQWDDEKKQRLAPRLIGRQWETTAQFIILADYVAGEAFAEKVIDYFNAYFVKQQTAADATDRLRTTLRALPRVLNQKLSHPGFVYSAKDIHEVVSSYMEEDAKEYFKTKHVIKNLDTIGFRNKSRASGGVRIEITEAALRAEFTQRRVDPYPEDLDWLNGKVSYQNQPPKEPEETDPWWERTEDNAPTAEEG